MTKDGTVQHGLVVVFNLRNFMMHQTVLCLNVIGVQADQIPNVFDAKNDERDI